MIYLLSKIKLTKLCCLVKELEQTIQVVSVPIYASETVT